MVEDFILRNLVPKIPKKVVVGGFPLPIKSFCYVNFKPQNAYAKGWSVETVMHEVVGYIEKTPTLV